MTTRDRGIFRRFQSQPYNKTSSEVINYRELFNVDAPYQRGSVWGPDRQRKLIESMMLGIPIGAIIINRRHWLSEDVRNIVVDGKQRLTAIWDLIDDKYTIPAEWFGDCTDHLSGMVTYSQLPDVARRMLSALSVPIVEANLATVEEEAELFDRVNFHGVAQGDADADSPAGAGSA